MEKSKKFGTIAGVFTPSVLTILGVIMYMRLSWVVGEAGIFGAVGIILIAHVISVTTGLSISSVATDKKIKTGGIYYMLSRSLGLPMGGAIGIALFVGTALSISLYIIGFTENFLSIEIISDFLNLKPGINSYRIVGSAVLLILTILALISTSLVIKSQYIILSTIALSLISVFVGFGMHPEYLPETPRFFPSASSVSLEKVFAIFFPAVTGFTAGVAMSGDLVNPRKNIPNGTLLAIAVGFIVYLTLAVSFGLFVDSTVLSENSNIIMDVSWLPQLVIAGIWGATLSSALGGILGGPRILQALSLDGVTPRIFGKGFGASNEPRTALIMIFLIAEGGILIGNLNVIAGIVTMFYLTSYGFINLAYVLESWAGPDFRPSFKVSRLFGIVGFLFAFAVMFQLDMISMLAAFVIIGIIYFVLQRRQLKLDYGDVWQSVWVSVVRRGLRILDHNSMEDRNWQPNIILFSGGDKKRAHLLEFGSSLVGKYGFLSNFDLTVNKEADVLFPKYRQSIPERNDGFPGLFTRRQSCKNIYDGIEMIVRTYGFSGIEPNTIVMGWGRQSAEPERFVKLIQTINKLDYNVLLVDYDKRFGYGNYKQIDIWWRGAGNNGNFALTLAKFMLTSEQWENAKIRLMIVSNEYSKTHYIYRQANEILDNMRLEADVKVVNNEVERKAFYDIIRSESKHADIVFLGIPGIMPGSENEFVQKTNVLLHKIGTVVLLRAATVFKELNLGVNISQQSVISESHNFDLEEKIANEIIDSRHPELNLAVREGFKDIISLHESTVATLTFKEFDAFLVMLQALRAYIEGVFSSNELHKKTVDSESFKAYLSEIQTHFVIEVNAQIENFVSEALPELREMMVSVLNDYRAKRDSFIHAKNDRLILHFEQTELRSEHKKSLKIFGGKALIKPKTGAEPVFGKKARKQIMRPMLFELLEQEIEQIRIEGLRYLYRYAAYVKRILFVLSRLKTTVGESDQPMKVIEDARTLCDANYSKLETETKHIVTEVAENRKKILILSINEFLRHTDSPREFYLYKERMRKIGSAKTFARKTDELYDLFFKAKQRYSDYTKFKNLTALFARKMSDLLKETFADLAQEQITEVHLKTATEKIKNESEQIGELFPKAMNLMSEHSMNNAFHENFSDPKLIQFPARQIVMRFMENELHMPLKALTEQYLAEEKNRETHSREGYIDNLSDIAENIASLDARKLIALYETGLGNK